MHNAVDKIEDLLGIVLRDKVGEGEGAFTANRYPMRFVLFDNFSDCYQFVCRMAEMSAQVIRISQWIDNEWPDVLIGYNKLAEKVENILTAMPVKDVILSPFSELARFYDNQRRKEFDALISTLISLENSKEGSKVHRRVYIPLVGLEGKMVQFYTSSHSFSWHLKRDDHPQNYSLIFTKDTTFGVKGVDNKYTTTHSVREWLDLWTKPNLTQTIICTSPSLFDNARYADPDNAFTFTVCKTAYQFLTEGLKLDLHGLEYREEDEAYWALLAQEIDVEDFHFETFFNSKFHINELAHYTDFLHIWFTYKKPYDRWLLSTYYRHKCGLTGYVCRVLNECKGYTNVNLAEALVSTIFDLDGKENYREERAEALQAFAKNGVVISKEREDLLREQLIALTAKGYDYALSFFSQLTHAEKTLMITWLGHGKISVDRLKDIYPDLYYYISTLQGEGMQEWVCTYMDEYRKAKVAHQYTPAIGSLIRKHNGSEVAFLQWYQSFSTTHTLLDGRSDIEGCYWIDGLGIDWIPFVSHLIEQHNDDSFFLNETLLAKALYPTTTAINKESLLKMAQGHLPKVGDIDEQAHKTRRYPDYLIEDFSIVRSAIEKVLDENPGRKIAIVSDHGLSYLSQLCAGLNLTGVTSDHGGRVAIKKSGTATTDSKYLVLNDKQTLCALRHESLCAKIGEGSGCHGGCTPEEVLVPVFIISSQPNAKTWTSALQKTEVSFASPILHFTIKGLKTTDKPIAVYNGKNYPLKNTADDAFVTPTITFIPNVETVIVKVDNISEIHQFKLMMGAEEEDPFAF